MLLKIFSPKKIAKKWAFLTQNKAKLCKFLIITLVFEKNAIFFAENWQKSQKIVIITSTPDELFVCTYVHHDIDKCCYGKYTSLGKKYRTNHKYKLVLLILLLEENKDSKVEHRNMHVHTHIHVHTIFKFVASLRSFLPKSSSNSYMIKFIIEVT
jgi:hypothetical protein